MGMIVNLHIHNNAQKFSYAHFILTAWALPFPTRTAVSHYPVSRPPLPRVALVPRGIGFAAQRDQIRPTPIAVLTHHTVDDSALRFGQQCVVKPVKHVAACQRARTQQGID